MITEERLKDLASRRGEPVVASVYLDVDGRRYPKLTDVEPHLEALLRSARERAEERGVDMAAMESVFDQIRGRLREGFDRSRTRGVVFFGCRDYFEALELPRPVRNQVVLNQVPALRQLEWMRDEYERFVVALVDRQRARVFRFELGELVERSELFDPVPPRVDGTDDGGLMASHVQRHSDEVARRHLKHAADAVMREVEESGARRVLVGGPTEARAEFEELLHPYVAERVAGRLSVSVQASDTEIRDAALEAEHEVERRAEAEVVERLREALGADQRGVSGLEDSLRAVYEKRVDVLLVSHGYEEPGWRCDGCEYLALRGSTCPMCQGAMEHVDDVVGEAIDQALLAKSRVEICENPDLDVLGRIGALLRF